MSVGFWKARLPQPKGNGEGDASALAPVMPEPPRCRTAPTVEICAATTGTDSGDRRYPRASGEHLEVRNLWATIENVSIGGICLRVSSPLPVGESYSLVLTDRRTGQSRNFVASVMWCAEGRAGLEWQGLSSELAAWLRPLLGVW